MHLSYMKKIIALLYYYFLKIIRNGAEMILRRITIERFKKLSKREKKARLDEEDKQLRQRLLEKEQQEHQLDLQNMTFESEMNQ